MALPTLLMERSFWYNADLIAEAGLTSPRELEAQGNWTWDAVVEMAARLTETEGDRVTRWGFNYPYWSTGWFGHHLLAWGADWWNEDFTAPTINSPEAVAGHPAGARHGDQAPGVGRTDEGQRAERRR